MKRNERINDPEETLREAMNGRISQIQTAMPAIVESVDLVAQTISAQPAIKGIFLSEDGEISTPDLPLLIHVPIVWPRAGGFSLTFPIAQGDEVLIIFASRCIDAWWQQGGIQPQLEFRMNDLSDGFAILAPTSQSKKLSNVSSANAQLRDDAGTTFLEITPDGKISINAQSEINLTAPDVNINSTNAIITSTNATIESTSSIINTATFEVNASTSATITSPDITLDGAVTQSGGTMTIGGSNYATHAHSGVFTGGSNTGPVV